MDDVRFTFNELIIFFTIINTLLGLLFGLFPLIVGFKNGNRKYAIIGLITSIIGGFLLSIVLAFPIAFIFTILSLRKAETPVDGAEPSPIV